MAKKKWAQDVKLEEGSLTALGWPSPSAVVSSVKKGKVSYAKAIQKLQYLANVSKDQPTVTKAKATIVRLQREVGGKNKKK